MRVLVADDDRDLAESIAAYVEECGHEVVATVTGGGLAVIQTFARCMPDVVLLDIQMPRFNGLTASHALVSRKPDVKIVFISGSVDEKDPMVRDCGAAAYLQKPVSLVELREVLDTLEGQLLKA